MIGGCGLEVENNRSPFALFAGCESGKRSLRVEEKRIGKSRHGQ
jgi:hypothetical protein